MNWLGESGLAVAVGVVSALLPLVNAEAYALIAAARTNGARELWSSRSPWPWARPSESWCCSRPPDAGSGRLHARLSRLGRGPRSPLA